MIFSSPSSDGLKVIVMEILSITVFPYFITMRKDRSVDPSMEAVKSAELKDSITNCVERVMFLKNAGQVSENSSEKTFGLKIGVKLGITAIFFW